MIVYVESNFVLEVALEQEQASSAEDKCFLSRDRNAFGDNPQIKSELASYNCRYIGSFREGLRFKQRFA